jgi:hypothetical protein
MVASLHTIRKDTQPRAHAATRVTHGLAVHLFASRVPHAHVIACRDVTQQEQVPGA